MKVFLALWVFGILLLAVFLLLMHGYEQAASFLFGILFGAFFRFSIKLIKGATITLLMVSLCSCTGYMHEAGHLADGTNFERDRLFKLGGTASQRGADGSSIVTDDQTSFRDLTTAAVGIQGSISGANINASNNALKSKQAAEETLRAKNAADAANRALELQNQGQPVLDGTGVLNGGKVLR